MALCAYVVLAGHTYVPGGPESTVVLFWLRCFPVQTTPTRVQSFSFGAWLVCRAVVYAHRQAECMYPTYTAENAQHQGGGLLSRGSRGYSFRVLMYASDTRKEGLRICSRSCTLSPTRQPGAQWVETASNIQTRTSTSSCALKSQRCVTTKMRRPEGIVRTMVLLCNVLNRRRFLPDEAAASPS